MMRCSLTISVLWILGAAVLVSAFDQASTSTSSIDPVRPLEIVNRVDGFRRFYAKAAVSPLDADARYALWKREGGTAAVPPGPDGEAMARRLLDAAWPRYPDLMPKVDELTRAAEDSAGESMAATSACSTPAGTQRARASCCTSASSTTTRTPRRRSKAGLRSCSCRSRTRTFVSRSRTN